MFIKPKIDQWRIVRRLVTVFGMVALLALVPDSAQAQWPQFSGQVFGMRGYAQGFGYDFVKTGILYSGGEEVWSEDSLPVVEHTGILRAETVRVLTGGDRGSRSVYSQASLANLSFFVGGNRITATAVKAFSSGKCVSPSAEKPLGGPVLPPGGSEITNLVINGITVLITGKPNQTVLLPNGKVIINEQKSLIAGNTAFSTVNALHVIVNGVPGATAPLADMLFSSASSYLVCECPGILYGARTAAAIADVSSVKASILDSTHIDGGRFEKQQVLPSASIDDVLTIENITTSMTADNLTTESRVSFATLNLSALGATVSASVISATAVAQCATVSGTSNIANLVVNGQAITVTGQPNQTTIVGNVRVVINEQRPLTDTGIQVIALHVYIYSNTSQTNLLGNIQLATAVASVTCGCP